MLLNKQQHRLVSRSERMAKLKRSLLAIQQDRQPNRSSSLVNELMPIKQLPHRRNITPNRLSPSPLVKQSSTQHRAITNQSQSLDKKRRLHPARSDTKTEKAYFLSRLLTKCSTNVSRELTHEEITVIRQEQFRLELNELRNSFVQIEQPKKRPSFFDGSAKQSPYVQHVRKNQKIEQNDRKALRARKQFEDYLGFICAPADEVYEHGISFDGFRELRKKEAADKVQIRLAYAIENLFLMAYESLIGQDRLGTPRPQALREYCHFYFSQIQKSQLETIIAWGFLKGFQPKLRELFLSQRTCMFYLYLLNDANKVDTQECLELLKKIIYQLHLTYSMVIQIVIEAIEGHDDPTNKINNTFKVLKSMCEIQKSVSTISEDLRQLARTSNIKGVFDVEKHLHCLLQRTNGTSRLEERILRTEMELSWKYLKIPPIPYLPYKDSKEMFTLVLDLDETLVFYDENSELLKFRPGLMAFLETLSKHYELVLFTASTKEYADKILKEIDPKKAFFDYRLYREHMRYENRKLLKDITKLGRDIRKVVVLDNVPDNYRNCLANGITIETWLGSKTDTALLSLLPILRALVDNNIEDVREFLRTQKLTLTHISQQNEESINSMMNR